MENEDKDKDKESQRHGILSPEEYQRQLTEGLRAERQPRRINPNNREMLNGLKQLINEEPGKGRS